MATSIMSFGIKHGLVEDPNVLVVNLLTLFPKNPYHNPALRSLTGLHPEVAEDISKAPGFATNYHLLKQMVDTYPGPVAINCMGGKHRSVYLAERLGRELKIPVHHRDLNKARSG